MTAATALSLGVTGWRERLTRSGTLSGRFAHRHAVLLAEAERFSSAECCREAISIAPEHPRRALCTLLGLRAEPPVDRRGRSWAITVSGSNADIVASLLACGDLDHVLAASPDLEQTWVPLHPDRGAKLVNIAGQQVVALRWPSESVHKRHRHHRQMAEVAERASCRAGLPIEVWEDYTICDAGAAHVWTFTRNLGVTVEDRLRALAPMTPERTVLVRAITALRSEMLEQGVIWQGFAPRNMFYTDGRLRLIDFEETVRPDDNPVRAAECLLWHLIFFADALTADERAVVFECEPPWVNEVPSDAVLAADKFEAALLGEASVHWRTRKGLLADSARLEAAHVRPGSGSRGPNLFGHELGHFWGDFVAPAVEVEIFRHLREVTSTPHLTAVLEVFEAAMEADILRAMFNRAIGSNDLSTPHTDATAESLAQCGVDAVADARAQAGNSWYERFDAEPRELINTLLFGVQAATAAQSSFFLLGPPGQRVHTSKALQDAVSLGVEFVHRHDRGEPVIGYKDVDALREMVALDLPVEGCDFRELLDETAETVVRHSILQSHPGYLAFPDSANSLAAVAGGLLGRLLNQNLIAVDRSAPAATFVEIQTIAWLRQLVGYPSGPLTAMRGVKDVGGLWTTGGHLSNHVAMLAALGARFPEARRGGLRSLETAPAVVMAGPIAHYSHSDAAFHLGLGWDAILSVDARSRYTTDVDAVEKALADPPDGRTPFMVVGVAGNCRTTGLDELAALAEVCRSYGVWFHVDACHGGSLIFSQRLREQHLAGIAEADSVSLDPHKGLFTPYPSSYVLFRDPRVLAQFSRHEATVMRDDCWDLGLITPFLGSRGFESLATWMMLRHIGVRGLGALVEGRQALVRYLARRIDATGLFVALNDVDFYRLAFVLCPPQARALIARMDNDADRLRAAKAVSAFTSQLNTQLYQQGEVCFDEHTLADLGNRVGAGVTGYTVMAACPGNPALTLSDLDRAVELLVEAARPAAEQLVAHLRDQTGTAPVHGHGGPAGWSD